MITGKLYDYLKWLAQVLLPALGILYVALAGLWDLPSAQAVAGTILAVDTFLGVLLGISQTVYNRQVGGGVAMVSPKEGGGLKYSLVLDGDPSDLADMKEVRFRVTTPGPTGASLQMSGPRRPVDTEDSIEGPSAPGR